jgi:hypothetical protein
MEADPGIYYSGADANNPECLTYDVTGDGTYTMFYCGPTATSRFASASTSTESQVSSYAPPFTSSPTTPSGSASIITFGANSSPEPQPSTSSNKDIPTSSSAPQPSGSANSSPEPQPSTSSNTNLPTSSSAPQPSGSANEAGCLANACVVAVVGSIGTLILLLA